MSVSQDFQIGRGDNAPDPTWQFPFDLTGSLFELDVRTRGATWTFLSNTADLAVNIETGTVAWVVSSTISELLPLGRLTQYTLRRFVPGGEIRIYAGGHITVLDGPVDPSLVIVAVAGPQGPAGGSLTTDQINAMIAAQLGGQTFGAGSVNLLAPGNFWFFAGAPAFPLPTPAAGLDLSRPGGFSFFP